MLVFVRDELMEFKFVFFSECVWGNELVRIVLECFGWFFMIWVYDMLVMEEFISLITVRFCHKMLLSFVLIIQFYYFVGWVFWIECYGYGYRYGYGYYYLVIKFTVHIVVCHKTLRWKPSFIWFVLNLWRMKEFRTRESKIQSIERSD